MRFWVGVAAVLALAAAVLLMPLRTVRGEAGVRLLGDTDPHYHVLRAERMAKGAPGAPWRDPALGWPDGAEILWPPLFDAAIVAAARAAGADTRDEFALAASFVPPALGVVSILLVALVGRLIGGPAVGLIAGGLCAVLPALSRYALLGRVDQHVAEVLLATAIAGAFLKSVERQAPRRWPMLLGMAIALSFWTWMGSTVALIAPCATAGVALASGLGELAGRAGRALAIAGVTSAALLVASVLVFGAPGALGRATLGGVGGFHVAISMGVAAYGAALAGCARRPAPPIVRTGEVLAAVGVPAALLFALWPALREGVVHGWYALAAANPWYEDIREFRPVLFSGVQTVMRDATQLWTSFGAVPLVAAIGVAAGRRRWVVDPAARSSLSFLAIWATVTLALSIARVRFFPYFAIPCAIAAAMGVVWTSDALGSTLRRRWLGRAVALSIVAAALAPTIGVAKVLASGDFRVRDEWLVAARALRSLPSPEGRPAVGAPWELGHLIQYYADRPVIVSPFGTEAGETVMPDWTRFLFTTDPADAERVLLSRRAGLLLLRNPSHELVGLRGFAPEHQLPPLLVARDAWRGETVSPTARFPALIVSRLYFGDGAGGADGSLEFARLVWEGASTRPDHPLHEERLKAFEVLPGAAIRVEGASPGAGVIARVDVVTNTGRTFTWSTRRIADRAGAVSLRVPYATGSNGAGRAGVCVVSDGSRSAFAAISADAVETGGALAVSLSGATARR